MKISRSFSPRSRIRLSVLAALASASLWLTGCGGPADSGSGASDSSSTTGAAKTTSDTTTSSSTTAGPAPSTTAGDTTSSATVSTIGPPPARGVTGATSIAAGPLAPGFTLQRVGGGTISLASLKGKVVLLDFWATWCIPCMAELPDFQQLHAKYAGQGLVVLGMTGSVAAPSTPAQVAATRKSKGLTFPMVYTNAAVEKAYNTSSQIPASFLIDRQGHIIKEIHAAPQPSAVQFWSPLIESALKS